MFIGGYILRFFGTIVLYLYHKVLSIADRQNVLTFKEVWAMPYNNGFYGSVSAELLQKMIGVGVFILLAFIMHFFPSFFF